MTKFAEVKKYSCYRLIRALLVAAFMILVVADVAARQFTLVIDAAVTCRVTSTSTHILTL